MRLFFVFAALMAMLGLTGCSTVSEDKTLGWSVQRIYSEAKENLDGGSYRPARELYGKLLARYPFGRYAQQAQLDLIQLEYKDREFDQAIAQADKFLQLYPTSPYADYARYMKGVISYSRDVGIIDKLVPTNIAQSDQALMKKAFEAFQALVEQNPEGKYSEDAQLRMIFLNNINAEHEIYVAEYYLRRGAYLAAVNRAKYVLENYQTTPSAALALGVKVRAYRELNLPDLADDAMRVLTLNFPDEITANERLVHLLTGDLQKKRGFFSSIRQTLSTN
ncbi:outer membrane protein assembly factor BamD [Ostreibacterium oceani]|nr:outer membrane protein assembly factor BamD [Ostreibacterium oceani]